MKAKDTTTTANHFTKDDHVLFGKSRPKSSTILLSAILTIAGSSALALPQSASAASNCPTSALRYSSTSNTLYVTGSTISCTPADLNSYKPTLVTGSAGTYLVNVNLKFSAGATFDVTGTSVSGGTTNVLRLKSNNGTAVTDVVSVIADYGNIRFDHTNVTSWNTATNSSDLEYATYKRAFVAVRSRLVSGAKNESRMDVLNSDISNLGYNGTEAYGLTWKVEGSAFSTVDVLGDIKNSRIHGNYFGVFTFGAYGMNIDSNEFDHNIKYGLDPHDDSDSLVINGNNLHDNGSHGLICSQRCDHLTITNNTSTKNKGNGIMLHRSVDDSVVDNNIITGNSDAGIALFESNTNTVTNNTITGNVNGIRLSVGSSYNTFSGNTISSSSKYGIYTYKGTDIPARPGNNGINSFNKWTSNTVSKSGVKIMKLTATYGDTFDSNDFTGNVGIGFDLSGANLTDPNKTKFTNNKTDPGVTLPK